MFEITVNDSFTISSGRLHFDVRAMEAYGVRFVTDAQGLRDLRQAIDATLSDLTDSEKEET